MATINKIGDGLQDKTFHNSLRIFEYVGPAAYVAGGDSLTPEAIGLGRIDAVICGSAFNGSAMRLVNYDYTNKKMVWYVPNTGSEATGDLSAYKTRVVVVGK